MFELNLKTYNYEKITLYTDGYANIYWLWKQYK